MIGRLELTCSAVLVASIAAFAWNWNRYFQIGPLTTVVPYALTAKRIGLAGDEELRDGIRPVLVLQERVHEALDVTFVQARAQLEERLRTDVQIADSASSVGNSDGGAGRLLSLGVTAKALADVDRCEHHLRQAAGLAAQLIIDTNGAAVMRVSPITYREFNTQMSAAIEGLGKLERDAKVLSGEWTRRAEALEQAREALQTRWGMAKEQADAPDLFRDAARAEVGNADLERIGQEQLDSWRKRAAEGGR